MTLVSKVSKAVEFRAALSGLGAVAAALLALAAQPVAAMDHSAAVLASGLNSPRGLAFAPDGALWVTESGTPGGNGPSTVVRGQTFTYNETGSVTRIQGGSASRVLTGLPAIFVQGSGQMDAGPNDIAFDGAGLAVLIGGPGNPAVRFTDLAPVGYQFGRLLRLGSAVDIAAHEAAANPAGGALDSNPWNLAPSAAGMLVTDAAANALLRVAADGSVQTVATFAARALGGPRPTESVPTGVALGPDGAAYVGELTGFPFIPGTARVHRVASDGSQTVFADGFTMVIDIAFAADGSLAVLEYDSNGLLAPGGTGRLWTVAADGSRKDLLWSDGLATPTGLAVGPDGAYYVANLGNGGPGAGQILRIAPVPEPGTLGLLVAGIGTLMWRRRGPGGQQEEAAMR